ncbi:hypothetical protein [Plantactinospora endophytica]|uniref:Uncharacterized protein n=1 Tax=Plantactinospora endophytica TaxID=673535 RepID=A0ABQ4E043_9ACTN|nr:hypothetical protein [Plantactinospora endophytica]GIG88038.1 hypothetical protein Pen02_29740 [Plantactinospora endophytica]
MTAIQDTGRRMSGAADGPAPLGVRSLPAHVGAGSAHIDIARTGPQQRVAGMPVAWRPSIGKPSVNFFQPPLAVRRTAGSDAVRERRAVQVEKGSVVVTD